MSDPGAHDVELGPFFAAGLILVVLGVRRRRVLPVALGVAAILFEQRTEPGRRLRRRIRRAVEERSSPQAVPDSADDQSANH